MNRDVQESIVEALQQLCVESEGAEKFFKWASQRQNDASFTSIDVFERKSGMDRAACIELAKRLTRIGCGRYVVGRRGSKTRVNWDYGLKSIARAAMSQQDKLDPVDAKLVAELEDQPETPTSEETTTATGDKLTIAEAKRRLAASLGVSVNSIDITIRG
jgi:hypothetical protein